MKTKKTKKDFEVYLLKIIGKYTPILMLQKHTFVVKISEESDWDNQPAFDSGYFGSLFNFPYLNATIVYSKEALDDWIKENTNMTPYIIHEMCHTITDPLYSKATERYITKEEIENEREILTEHISSIILRGGVRG
jgi:hypothetical protein